MLIPPTSTVLCPARILDLGKRSFTSSVVSTADSFKSWDSCMDNKACKIIAIVGIVLAVLVVFWLVSTFVRCCCLGATCIEGLCCCCCRSPRPMMREVKDPYANENMYSQPPQAQPQPAYFANPGYNPVATNGYGYVGDKSAKSIYDDENPFADENSNQYEMNHLNSKENNHSYQGYYNR